MTEKKAVFEELKEGQYIKFTTLNGITTEDWNIKTHFWYRINDISIGRVYIDEFNQHDEMFFVTKKELENVYVQEISEVKEKNNITLEDVLCIIGKNYENIPSPLIGELIMLFSAKQEGKNG